MKKFNRVTSQQFAAYGSVISSGTPVIVYGVNIALTADDEVILVNGDINVSVNDNLTFTLTTGNYTYSFGEDGVLFPDGCDVSITNGTITVLYKKYNGASGGAPLRFQEIVADAAIASSGQKVAVSGIFVNPLAAAVGELKLYHGTSSSGTLLAAASTPAGVPTINSFGQPVILPNGGYITITGATTDTGAVFYKKV